MLKTLYRIRSWCIDPFCDANLFFRASKPIWIFLTFRIQSFSNICFRAVQWFGWKRILTIVVQVEWNETKWRKIVRIFFFLLMMIAEGSRLGWLKKAILLFFHLLSIWIMMTFAAMFSGCEVLQLVWFRWLRGELLIPMAWVQILQQPSSLIDLLSL